MKFAVLSRRASLYSTRRLVEAGRERGHEMHVINYVRCYMDITSRKPQVMFRGEPVSGFDAVIPRVGASHAFYGASVVRQFEMMGTFSSNESQGINRAHDKLRQLQLLARAGIGLPVTGFAHDAQDIDGILETVGGAPGRRQAARRHAGQGRRPRRDPQGGRVGDRGLSRARREHPRAGVHQGVEGLRHPRLRRRRPRRRGDGAACGAGRVPLQHPSRRLGREGDADAGGADDRQEGGEDDRPRGRRRRHDALQPGPGRARGQQLPRPRGDRGGDRRRRRRRGDQVPRDAPEAEAGEAHAVAQGEGTHEDEGEGS